MSRGVSRHICLIAIMTPDLPHAEIKKSLDCHRLGVGFRGNLN